jgi:hypothetical protein
MRIILGLIAIIIDLNVWANEWKGQLMIPPQKIEEVADKVLREEWEKLQLKVVEEDKETYDWVKWNSLSKEDQNEVDLFWKDFRFRIYQKNKDRVIQNIQFPLDGEWGFVLEVKKSSLDLTSKDFKEGYDVIFNSLVKMQIYGIDIKTFDYMKSLKDGALIGFRVGVSLTEDADEFESSRFFTFSKTREGYKLSMIHHAG